MTGVQLRVLVSKIGQIDTRLTRLKEHR